MKHVILASAILAASTSSVLAQESDSSKVDTSGGWFGDGVPAPLQLPIDVGYTYFPGSGSGNDFRLAEASVEGGANLTCAGVTLDGTMSQMINQIESVGQSLANNALGIGVNYLIFSSPTVYALIQNLQESFEMNLGGANMACQMARSSAKKNWDQNSDQARVAECMDKHGGMSADCVKDDSNIVLQFAEKKDEWSGKIDSALEDVNGFFAKDCEALDSEEPTLLSMVFLQGPNQCEDLEKAQEYMFDKKINEATGDFETIAPEKSPSDVINGTAAKIAELLDQVVDADTKKMTSTDAYKGLTDKQKQIKLSYSQQRMMKQLKKEDPQQYEAYVQRLTTLMAINEMEQHALRLQVGLVAGAMNAGVSDLGETNHDFIQEQIEYLLAIAKLERKKIDAQQEQADLLDNGYKLLQESRMN